MRSADTRTFGCAAAPAAVAALALVLAGCTAVLKPSRHAREASFRAIDQTLHVRHAELLQSAYLLFSSDTPLEIHVSGPSRLRFDADGRRGLAVAVTHDGYLLTASHVAGANTLVFGPFGGVLELRPARVVARQETGPFGADVALLKVEGKVTPAPLGHAPAPGEPVIAVVTEWDETLLLLHFAGGSIRAVDALPEGGRLLHTNVPVWYGDSGGPLFDTQGRLLGINIGLVRRPFWTGFHTTRFTYAPAPEQLWGWIERDRHTLAQLTGSTRPPSNATRPAH